ncbi:hypothetical protein EFS38_01165 [Dickeya undicola]|uniref:Uncharacterized protein n=1 Tax=Dickeya undicola TaxID=1577887 RepID=A0A3N0G1H4_9GAMM|nr:hypothetical protein EF878_10120 [Dickeya undicola]RNM28671.1 hypothetical protein EFS38_01165 [Dickeya undicola]
MRPETDVFLNNSVNVSAVMVVNGSTDRMAVLQGICLPQYALIIESTMLINCEFTHKLKAVTWMI